jgi:hypothetical protein
MGKFFDFLVRCAEGEFQAKRESLFEMYNLREISTDKNTPDKSDK